jgi:hypothetical protein
MTPGQGPDLFRVVLRHQEILRAIVHNLKQLFMIEVGEMVETPPCESLRRIDEEGDFVLSLQILNGPHPAAFLE